MQIQRAVPLVAAAPLAMAAFLGLAPSADAQTATSRIVVSMGALKVEPGATEASGALQFRSSYRQDAPFVVVPSGRRLVIESISLRGEHVNVPGRPAVMSVVLSGQSSYPMSDGSRSWTDRWRNHAAVPGTVISPTNVLFPLSQAMRYYLQGDGSWPERLHLQVTIDQPSSVVPFFLVYSVSGYLE